VLCYCSRNITSFGWCCGAVMHHTLSSVVKLALQGPPCPRSCAFKIGANSFPWTCVVLLKMMYMSGSS
jgi:hypothetical protein